MLISTLSANAALAWNFFRQEYGNVHQRLLRWVQGILLVFIVTLSQSSNSIQTYLQQNLQGLLGADAVISQKQALTPTQYTKVRSLTDTVSVTQQVNTTLTHNGQWQQAQLKAVDEYYPLQGDLITTATLGGVGQSAFSGPEKGHIWLDARLFAGLSIDVGEQLLVAGKYFNVSRVLQHEPDRLMEGHNVSMRAMINAEDMKTLGLPADLIQYRYLLAADAQQVSQLINWQQASLPAAEVLHKQGKHPLALFWKRTENFMGLASIILFFMAAIAIEQLAQIHMKKDQFFTAICMSLGASKMTGIQVSILKWLYGVILLLPAVLLASTGFHYLVVSFLSETFPELTWQFDLFTTLKPLATVFLVFAIFHAPVWLSLIKSSVAKQLAGNEQTNSHWPTKVSSVIVLFCVAFAYSDNGLLTIMMLTAIAITIGLIVSICWITLTTGEKATQHLSGLVPFTLYMMKQRLMSKSTQILGVGLCAFLLLFTLMLLKDLGGTMSLYQRQHDGNVFISQASQEQMDYVDTWAQQEGIKIRQVKPYMYAKLIEINGEPVTSVIEKPSESLATFKKSIRLHWSESVPENNRVASGKWWDEQTEQWQQISIEQEVMTDLGLALGDRLTFFIDGKPIQFDITATHEFKPGAGSITFWVQMPPAALAHISSPHYNMASIELTEKQWSLLAPLWQKFPTLRMVSLKEMTQLFDKTLAMVTQVISAFSVMIVLLSSVVILASINAFESNEKKKNSVIMSFGFSRITCLKLNVIEWGVTAAITATGAILGTYIAGLLIYQSQFSLTYQPNFIWLIATTLLILTVITSLGVFASKNSLRSSIRQLMAST